MREMCAVGSGGWDGVGGGILSPNGGCGWAEIRNRYLISCQQKHRVLRADKNTRSIFLFFFFHPTTLL